MAFWEALLQTGAKVGADILGYNAATQGISKASSLASSQLKSDKKFRNQFVGILKQLMGEGAELREDQINAAIDALGGLREFATSAPGSSQFYKQGVETGTRDIMSNLSQYGLEDSNVSGEAVGRLLSGLLTSEEQTRLGVQQNLVAGAPNNLGVALGFGQIAAEGQKSAQQDVSALANLELLQGQTTAGFWSNIGQIPEDLGYLNQLSQLFGK